MISNYFEPKNDKNAWRRGERCCDELAEARIARYQAVT